MATWSSSKLDSLGELEEQAVLEEVVPTPAIETRLDLVLRQGIRSTGSSSYSSLQTIDGDMD